MPDNKPQFYPLFSHSSSNLNQVYSHNGEFDTDRGRLYIPGLDYTRVANIAEEKKALDSTWYMNTLKGAVNSITGAIPSLVSSVTGTIGQKTGTLNYADLAAIEDGTFDPKNVSQSIYGAIMSAAHSVEKGVTFDIYRTQYNKENNPLFSTDFLVRNAGYLVDTIALVFGAGAAKMLSKSLLNTIAKQGAKNVSKGFNRHLLKLAKGSTASEGISNILAGTTSRFIESNMEGIETFKSAFEEYNQQFLEEGLSAQEAASKAEMKALEAAHSTAKANMLLAGFDIFQVAKAFKYTRRTDDIIDKAKKAKRFAKGKDYLAGAGSEFIEEVLQKEISDYAQANPDANRFETFINASLKGASDIIGLDKETWDAGLSGAFGGAVFQGTGDSITHMSKQINKIRNKVGENSDTVANTNKILDNTSKEFKDAISSEDVFLSQATSNLSEEDANTLYLNLHDLSKKSEKEISDELGISSININGVEVGIKEVLEHRKNMLGTFLDLKDAHIKKYGIVAKDNISELKTNIFKELVNQSVQFKKAAIENALNNLHPSIDSVNTNQKLLKEVEDKIDILRSERERYVDPKKVNEIEKDIKALEAQKESINKAIDEDIKTLHRNKTKSQVQEELQKYGIYKALLDGFTNIDTDKLLKEAEQAEQADTQDVTDAEGTTVENDFKGMNPVNAEVTTGTIQPITEESIPTIEPIESIASVVQPVDMNPINDNNEVHFDTYEDVTNENDIDTEKSEIQTEEVIVTNHEEQSELQTPKQSSIQPKVEDTQLFDDYEDVDDEGVDNIPYSLTDELGLEDYDLELEVTDFLDTNKDTETVELRVRFGLDARYTKGVVNKQDTKSAVEASKKAKAISEIIRNNDTLTISKSSDDFKLENLQEKIKNELINLLKPTIPNISNMLNSLSYNQLIDLIPNSNLKEIITIGLMPINLNQNENSGFIFYIDATLDTKSEGFKLRAYIHQQNEVELGFTDKIGSHHSNFVTMQSLVSLDTLLDMSKVTNKDMFSIDKQGKIYVHFISNPKSTKGDAKLKLSKSERDRITFTDITRRWVTNSEVLNSVSIAFDMLSSDPKGIIKFAEDNGIKYDSKEHLIKIIEDRFITPYAVYNKLEGHIPTYKPQYFGQTTSIIELVNGELKVKKINYNTDHLGKNFSTNVALFNYKNSIGVGMGSRIVLDTNTIPEYTPSCKI